MTLNLDNYRYLEKDTVQEFFDIDFGHLWWYLGKNVWKKTFAKMKRANVLYKNLEYKELRLFILAICFFVCRSGFSVYCIIAYFVLVNRRKTNYFVYKEYEERKK